MEECGEFVNIFNSDLHSQFVTRQNSFGRIINGDYGDPHDTILDDPHSQLDQSLNFDINVPSPYSGLNINGDIDEASADFLKYINEILIEQELDDQITSFHDHTALCATEKSLYDVLGDSFPSSSDEYPSPPGQSTDTPDDNFHLSTVLNPAFDDETPNFDCRFEEVSQYVPDTPDETRGRKNVTRDEGDYERGRRNKHFATDTEDYVQIEQYDDVLLCKEDTKGNICCDNKDGSSDDGERGNFLRKKTRRKRQNKESEVVDLVTLLTQCAQAVSNFDLRNANELLDKIRLHSSQYGDSSQRVAHYFANALEARLQGTGWQQLKNFCHKPNLRTSQILKAYKEHVTAIPFRRACYYLANDTITKLCEKATRIHVIDFGIFYGFQWPALIQMLSKRKVGPPMLRITGIDYPESGFRPAQKVEETGRRLEVYCKRFNVPFKYQAIAKPWEDVTLEDINIEKDEMIVVNSVFMSRRLADETVEKNNPRDSFFNFIRKLNPDVFIHGIVNGLYGAPFFLTRFKEALFHYSSVFDMFEATLPRESEERIIVESYLHGEEILNVLACEGAERIERPETYRQWQVRIQKAGFRKMPLDYELVERLKGNVKYHHKDFVVDSDRQWMLQGWKGRILYAISCWRSA